MSATSVVLHTVQPRTSVSSRRHIASSSFLAVLYGVTVCSFSLWDEYKPLPGYINVFDILIAALLLAAVHKLLLGFRGKERSLIVAILLICCIRAASVLSSPFYETSLWISVMRYLNTLAVIVVFPALFGRDGVRRLFGVLIFFTFLDSCVALAQPILSSGHIRGMGIGSSRGLCEFQALGIVYYLTAICEERKWRLARTAIVVVLGAGLVASITRTSWGMACISIVVLCGFGVMAQRHWRYLLVGMIVLGLGVFAVGSLGEKYELVSGRVKQMRDVSGGVAVRLGLWRAALGAFLEHPVVGIGSGVFSRNSRALLTTAGEDLHIDEELSVHNTVIQTLVETGLLGFGAFLLYATLVVRRGWKLAWFYKERANNSIEFRRERCLAFALGAVAIAVVVCDFYAAISFTPYSNTVIGMLMAFAVSPRGGRRDMGSHVRGNRVPFGPGLRV